MTAFLEIPRINRFFRELEVGPLLESKRDDPDLNVKQQDQVARGMQCERRHMLAAQQNPLQDKVVAGISPRHSTGRDFVQE